MKTLKITEVNPQGPGFIAQFLTFLARKMSFPIEMDLVAEFDNILQSQSDALVVDMALSTVILPSCSLLSTQVRNVGVLDSFFKEDGGWIPRLLLFDVLRDVLVSKASDLDIRCPSFVIGDNARAKVAAAVLADLGYSEIYMVSEEEETLMQAIGEISRNYIGIKFKPLLASDLTMQALSASVLINTLDLSTNPTLLNDLSYFNFMKREGWVLDLNVQSAVSKTLVNEAEKADLKIIETGDVVGFYALHWLRHLGVENSVDFQFLKDAWNEFLETK